MPRDIRHSPQFLQKRKMALILPLFVLPVACLLFWLFDGGKQTGGQGSGYSSDNINTNIPAPPHVNIEGSGLNTYLHTPLGRTKEEQIGNLLQADLEGIQQDNPGSQDNKEDSLKNPRRGGLLSSLRDTSSNPASKMEKEQDELKRQLDAFYQKKPRVDQNNDTHDMGSSSSEVENSPPLVPSTTENISSTLETNQNQKDLEEKNANEIYEISAKHKKNIGTLARSTLVDLSVEEAPDTGGNRFYTIEGSQYHEEMSNTISAVIHQDQTLVEGSTVKLRLLSDVNVNGKLVPKDSFVYGVARFSNERLNVEISNIRYRDDIFPFHLDLYDQDGLRGISIPGASPVGQSKKEALAQIVDGLQVPNILGGQSNFPVLGVNPLPSTGKYLALEGVRTVVNATKSLISGKLRKEKVYVKANYRVYLKK